MAAGPHRLESEPGRLQVGRCERRQVCGAQPDALRGESATGGHRHHAVDALQAVSRLSGDPAHPWPQRGLRGLPERVPFSLNFRPLLERCFSRLFS